jgi:DNA modification methylase
MTIHTQTVESSYSPPGMLPGFYVSDLSAIEAKTVRRETVDERAARCADLVNSADGQWIIWTGLNNEAERLEQLIPESVNVHGSMTPEVKAQLMLDFQDGKYRVLISKTKIAGFGMNFQNANNMAFCGLDFSWESYYQAIRRIYRFGQTRPVQVHIVMSTQESSVLESVLGKEREAVSMSEQLIARSAEYAKQEITHMRPDDFVYQTDNAEGQNWRFWLGDSVERMREIPDESVDLSIYSPPFSDLFVYSATPRDIGNSNTPDEFFEHYGYIIRENLRVTKPGRLACVHVTDLRTYKGLDGVIGRKDFSGQVIEAYQTNGWTFWQRITIDKNAQTQAIRLRDHGLAFSTLEKDSTGLAGAVADYLLIFKKPGDNAVPVTPLLNKEMTYEDWILWARPVWNDIRETATLNVVAAKSANDEKHMCPLQLPLIERCIKLWSNPGELIFSPFGGIGSEGYEAVRLNRHFLGIELKPEYWRVGCNNLKNAEQLNVPDMFAWAEKQAGNDQ